uniref:PAS domain-containing protein n=1 Tax=Steinernema glaseri TaxID=37863 RepID=A0A1I8ALP0_9BILA
MPSRVSNDNLEGVNFLHTGLHSAKERILPQDMPPSPPDSQKSTNPWAEADSTKHQPTWSNSSNTVVPTKFSLGERKNCVAKVCVSLPEGTVTEVTIFSNEDQHLANLAIGSSFLKQLHGKSVQTFLLHAFCGEPFRQMFARIECGGFVRPYELFCQFVKREKWTSTGIAIIEVVALRSAFGPSIGLLPSSIKFTTRHNTSGAIVFIDATSIPVLGHFPSELTGKSLFSVVHAEDANLVKQFHHALLHNGGKVVLTECLRLIAYNGSIVCIRSEWAAFMNPWSRQLEMIVGRHLLLSQTPIGDADVFAEPFHGRPLAIPTEDIAEHDRYIRTLLKQTIPRKERSGTAVRHVNPNAIDPYHSLEQVHFDRLVGTLNTRSEAQQTAMNPNDAALYDPTLDASSSPVSASLPLTYNQINCLENVHRLLKSQKAALDEASRVDGDQSSHESPSNVERAAPAPPVSTVPLTRDILQQHTQKWEQEYKDAWKKRLNLKRSYPYPNEIPSVSSESKIHRPEKLPKVRVASDPTSEYISNYQAQYLTAMNANVQSPLTSPDLFYHSLNYSTANQTPYCSVIQNGSFHSQHSQLAKSLPVAGPLRPKESGALQMSLAHCLQPSAQSCERTEDVPEASASVALVQEAA